MKIVIMSGGKGTRLNMDKPLAKICGTKNIFNLITISKRLSENIYIATVRYHPVVFALKEVKDVKIIYTSGKGYEHDILDVTNQLNNPLLILPSDIYLQTEILLLHLIDNCDRDICNLVFRKEYVGISLWKGENYENYKDVEVDIYPPTYNDLLEYIKILRTCKNK